MSRVFACTPGFFWGNSHSAVVCRYFTPLAFPWVGPKVTYVHVSVAVASYPAVRCSDMCQQRPPGSRTAASVGGRYARCHPPTPFLDLGTEFRLVSTAPNSGRIWGQRVLRTLPGPPRSTLRTPISASWTPISGLQDPDFDLQGPLRTPISTLGPAPRDGVMVGERWVSRMVQEVAGVGVHDGVAKVLILVTFRSFWTRSDGFFGVSPSRSPVVKACPDSRNS